VRYHAGKREEQEHRAGHGAGHGPIAGGIYFDEEEAENTVGAGDTALGTGDIAGNSTATGDTGGDSTGASSATADTTCKIPPELLEDGGGGGGMVGARETKMAPWGGGGGGGGLLQVLNAVQAPRVATKRRGGSGGVLRSGVSRLWKSGWRVSGCACVRSGFWRESARRMWARTC